MITATQKIEIQYKSSMVVLVDFCNTVGHQQRGIRPAVIVSNNKGNKYSPTVKVLPCTSKRDNSNLPTHAKFLQGEVSCLKTNSTFEAENEIVINKTQIIKILGQLTESQMEKIAIAMAYSTPIVFKAFLKGIQNTQQFKNIFLYSA